MKRQSLLLIICLSILWTGIITAAPFVAKLGPSEGKLEGEITLRYHPANGRGFVWGQEDDTSLDEEARMVRDAVEYLLEGLEKMTGTRPEVSQADDFSKGIVLSLFSNAPEDIQGESAIKEALKQGHQDEYDGNEAFYIRTEPHRVLVIANTAAGLSHGIVELLESVGYEVLGMGPNWVHVPDYRHKPLVFDLNLASRPGFYIRLLFATSGQERGMNTLRKEWVVHPEDEPVQESYARWRIGTRMVGGSMPRIRSGHALASYHRHVVRAMRNAGTTEGLLTDKKIFLGKENERPNPGGEYDGAIWISTDAKYLDSEIRPHLQGVYQSSGSEWKECKRMVDQSPLDLSSPLVREAILDDLKGRSEVFFLENPSENFHFLTDPEDGNLNYQKIGVLAAHPQWYPDYLREKGLPFGRAYALHGVKGLDQPTEQWDPASASDMVYAFNNWLLQEYDQWIDSLPPSERVTSSGKPKKQLVRTNLLSYNFHDVPPNFNLDPRIRIKIAGFPKNRGKGKWIHFKSHVDMAEAYRILLNGQPSVDYQIWSQAYFHDHSLAGISGSPMAKTLHGELGRTYHAGFRGFEAEADFNFGKLGLKYYLATKLLWRPLMSVKGLEGLRDRWFQRAFGPAWKEMKQYYDFMAPENPTVNSPNHWAHAIRLIEQADGKLKGGAEPLVSMQQRRLDDVKQYWYYYYLLDIGEAAKGSERYREFVWKGQMSYMTSMVMAIRRFFDRELVAAKVVDEKIRTQRAHFTHEETQKWWTDILNHWQLRDVTHFFEATLIDGTRASEVNLHDLVRTAHFRELQTVPNEIRYNRLPGPFQNRKEASFLTVAENEDDVIGFRLYWPVVAENHPENFPRDVPWGLEYRDRETGEWERLVDITTNSTTSKEVESGGKMVYLVEGKHVASRPGTYRFFIGSGDWNSTLTHLNDSHSGHVYYQPMEVSPVGPRSWFFYIPKSTGKLDLETEKEARRTLRLYKVSDTGGLTPSRTLSLDRWGMHSITLLPGERGTVAVLESAAFPILYSVPQLSAKSPEQLLIPRKLAEADGLLIHLSH